MPQNKHTLQAVSDSRVFVLRTDGNLFLVHVAPIGNVPSTREQVDAHVQDFEALSASQVYVLGTDGNLFLEHGPFGNVPPGREQVDAHVQDFQALSYDKVLVLGADGNLFLEHGTPFGNVPPTRAQVDAHVQDFQATKGVLAAPTGLHVDRIYLADDGSAILSVGWTDNSDNELGFHLEYEGKLAGYPDVAGSFYFEANIGSNTTVINSVGGLHNEYTYTMYVKATDAYGTSAPSNSIVVTIPGSAAAFISAGVQLLSQQPTYNIYGLVVNGSQFQSNESIQVVITWSVDGGSQVGDNLGSTADFIGAFSLTYLGNSGAGFCPHEGSFQVFTFHVQATGLTSHRTAYTTAQFQC